MPGCQYCGKRAIFGDYAVKKCTGPTNRQLGRGCKCDPNIPDEKLHYCYVRFMLVYSAIERLYRFYLDVITYGRYVDS